DAAVGATQAVRAAGRTDVLVGALGAPALSSRATIDELNRGDILRAVVAVRPRDLANAIVDLPHAILTGEPAHDIKLEPQTLTPGSPALRAHAADYSAEPAAPLDLGGAVNLNPISRG